MGEFSGKVALVTGGGSGLGEASALQLAAGGAQIAILDLRADRVEAVTSSIIAAGGNAIALPPTDVSDEAQMRAAMAALFARTERLDIVIANAGINGTWAPIDDITPAEWDKTVAVNLRGTYLTLHLTVPRLKAGGGGAIVIVASINGTRIFSTAGATAYSAAKAGQAAIAAQLALELAPHKIRVNAVAPGSTRTNMSENTWRRNTELARYPVEFPQGDIPLTGVAASADDVAEAIVMLASARARHVTGTLLVVDGGQSLVR